MTFPSLRSRSLTLLPLCLAGFTAVATAQRFDNWVAAPALSGFALSSMATDPTTGAPTLIVATALGADTVAWDGTSFVSLGLTGNPGISSGETLAPFSVGGVSGLVHLDGSGVTSVWTGGPSWTSLGVLSPSPSGRFFAAASSVVGFSGEAFVFGGGATTLLNDLWSFDGSTWTDRTPASGPMPVARQGASMVSNGQGGLVMVGGSTTTSTLNDVWSWNGTQWSFGGKSPGPRAFGSALLDVSRGALMLAGGISATGVTNDAFTLPLPLPLPGLVSASDWTQITVALPFVSATGFVTGALDAVRNEPVLSDLFGFEVVNDLAASLLVFGQSPTTNCIVPNLQLVGTPLVEPRIGTTTVLVPIGGLTPAAGAPMSLFAEFVTPGIGFTPAPTPIPGTSCLSFLSGAAINIANTTTLAGGQYQFNLVLPPNPALVGTVIDTQALGLFPTQIAATQAVRIVIGR